MDKKKINQLKKLRTKVEAFLLEYSKLYGKFGNRIKITKKVVQTFMTKSSEQDMKEVLSYSKYKNEMKLQNGAEDLEDYIQYVITKTK